MTNANTPAEPLPTIWEVPDDLWEIIKGVLDRYDPPKSVGRHRIDARNALNGIIYRMRTGCQWNHLPEEFGDDSSVHRTLQRWESSGIFDAIWRVIVSRCDELSGVDWQWQAADGWLGKARGVPKRGHKTPVSGQTPPIAPKRVLRKACSSTGRAVP
jgi:putative transposase